MQSLDRQHMHNPTQVVLHNMPHIYELQHQPVVILNKIKN